LMTGANQQGSSTNPLFNNVPIYPASNQLNIAPASFNP
jgi:hypothetical protein